VLTADKTVSFPHFVFSNYIQTHRSTATNTRTEVDVNELQQLTCAAWGRSNRPVNRQLRRHHRHHQRLFMQRAFTYVQSVQRRPRAVKRGLLQRVIDNVQQCTVTVHTAWISINGE